MADLPWNVAGRFLQLLHHCYQHECKYIHFIRKADDMNVIKLLVLLWSHILPLYRKKNVLPILAILRDFKRTCYITHLPQCFSRDHIVFNLISYLNTVKGIVKISATSNMEVCKYSRFRPEHSYETLSRYLIL